MPCGQSTNVWSDLPPPRTNVYGRCFIPGWQAENIETCYHLYRRYHLISPLYHKSFMGRSSIPEGPSQKSLDQVKKTRTYPLPAPICAVEYHSGRRVHGHCLQVLCGAAKALLMMEEGSSALRKLASFRTGDVKFHANR